MAYYGDFKYERTDSGIRITGYNGLDVARIPATINGLPVREIACGFIREFQECQVLTRVVIPDSVTSIGNRAFMHCSSLTNIKIPNSVTSIGDDAFACCSSLESVSLPDSVTTIGNGAFGGCSSLKGIIIPNSVTSIGNDAFACCSSLESVSLPDSVTTIGNGAFRGCESLKGIIIPDSVTTIGDDAFGGCKSLTSIIIPDSVTEFGGTCSPLFDCTNLKDIYLPESLIHNSSVLLAVLDVRKQSDCRVHYYNLPTVFFNKINRLKALSGISSDHLVLIEKIKTFIESKNIITV